MRTLLALVASLMIGTIGTTAQDVEPAVTITRPSLVEIGGQAQLTCTLSAKEAMTDGSCKFQLADGKEFTLNYNDGSMRWGGGSVVDPSVYEGIADPTGRTCSVIIKSVREGQDIGQWQCLMNQGDERPYFHIGTFQLLTPEIGHLRDIRLPRHLEPLLYTVDLVPFIDEGTNFTTAGKMRMIATQAGIAGGQDVAEFSNKFVLHSKDIIIHEDTVSLRRFNGFNEITGFEYDLEREFFVIHVKDSLFEEGSKLYHLVNMTFTSFLNDELRGFYRSSYVNEEGETEYLATTQFQYIDARRAFPCMDEPDMKAQFQISLGRKEDMTAVSNMDIRSTEELPEYPGYVVDTFRLSPKMSTYLAAMLVSDFVTTTSPTDPLFNIIHAPGLSNQAQLAATAGPVILEYYEQYFDIPYPLPKTDMVAVPDFKYGAMENWGLITYRESSILYDPVVSSQSDRDRVIEVIAHELAHMWFGNLVTMEWWTDLWLNEGLNNFKIISQFFRLHFLTSF